MKHIVLPFPFCGYGNIGDEAMLQGFASLVGKEYNISILTASPQQTVKVAPNFKHLPHNAAVPSADLYAIAGDTPITDQQGDWPLGVILNYVGHYKPFIFIGTGSEPLKNKQSFKRMQVIAREVKWWSVRSIRDKERMIGCTIPANQIVVAADLAWLVPPVSPDFGRTILPSGKRYIGIDITNEAWVLQNNQAMFQEIAAFLDIMVDKGFTPAFLANEVRAETSFEFHAIKRLRKAMRRSDQLIEVPRKYYTPNEMLSLVSCCEFTTGSRYHFCLFSALQGVPFIAMDRQPKVANLCEDLGWDLHLQIGQITTNSLLAYQEELMDKYNTLKQQLAGQVVIKRQEACKNIEPITRFFGEG